MPETPYRALIVDDEPAVRLLATRALHSEGFSCDAAADGVEAQDKISKNPYDVVITDLRMPNMNGHTLASNLLLQESRPAIVILTGVLEPKIARDLTSRGVDSIEFKPVDYYLLAAKVKGLVNVRKNIYKPAKMDVSAFAQQMTPASKSSWDDREIERSMIRKEEIESKLSQLTKILPISSIALDVFNMTCTETCENAKIAAVAGCDATLGVDILRIANSSFYNYTSKKIIDLSEAIAHIGQKRIGELALATNMMTAMTRNTLPWMDVDLTWRRSMAAAVAIDHLASKLGIPEKENRLFLCSISYPLGRIALCMLFPDTYEKMIKLCKGNHQSLKDEERQFFSLLPEEAMGFLLKAWNIPSVVFEPLVHSSRTYNALSSLSEPLVTRVKLLKIATLIAEISVGKWEAWDQIELPPAQIVSRLGIGSFAEIITKTIKDSQELINFKNDKTAAKEAVAAESLARPRPVAYFNLATESYDFLWDILSHSGFELLQCDLGSTQPDTPIIVNCFGVQPHRFLGKFRSAPSSNPKMLILTAPAQTESFSRFGKVLAIPTSFESLQSACHGILK